MKNLNVKCPICGKVFEWVRFPDHLEATNDGKHDELFHSLETQRNDAYFDAEYEFCEDYATDETPD